MTDSPPPSPEQPFWESTPLEDLSRDQWEALCDGCGKCCLNKYEDEDDGSMHYTNVSCRLLDADLCRCTDYANRAAQVDDCIQLTPETLRKPAWLPETCAYRLIREGRPLPSWHYLICGDREAVHRAAASVRGRIVCETQVDDPLMHLVDWVR